MAVIGIAGEARNSPRCLEMSLDVQRYEREFVVRTNSIYDGPNVVVGAVGIPYLWQPYQFGNDRNIIALARKYTTIERLAPGTNAWKVVVEYETPKPFNSSLAGGAQGGSFDVPGANQNPIIEMPSIEFDVENYQTTAYACFMNDVQPGLITPVPICNSAGEAYDPPPQMDASRLNMIITRNEPINTPHPKVAVYYQDTLNSDTFWGCPPGTVKVMSIKTKRASRQIANTGQIFMYLVSTYVFQFRWTWNVYLADKGGYYWSSSSTPSSSSSSSNPTYDQWIFDETSIFNTHNTTFCPWNPTTNNTVLAEPNRGTRTKHQFITAEGHPTTGYLDGYGGSSGSGANLYWNGPYTFYRRMPFKALQLPQSFMSFVGGTVLPPGS